MSVHLSWTLRYFPGKVVPERGSWERAVFYPSRAADKLCVPWGWLRHVTGNLPRVILNEHLKAPYCFLTQGQHECVLQVIKRNWVMRQIEIFIGQVWKNCKLQNKDIHYRRAKSEFYSTHPACRVQQWAAQGHAASCLHVPPCKVRAGTACVRSTSCQQGRVRHSDWILALLAVWWRYSQWLGTCHPRRQASTVVPSHLPEP